MGEPAPRSYAWKWYICGLLLLATMINYLDRQTLPSMAPRIQRELGLNDYQYGQLERGFGLAFATGAALSGLIADRVNLRWFYPLILLLWSAMGILTGFVGEFTVLGITFSAFFALLLCRTFLGLFEAGHWPCGLKTTQRLLEPRDRNLGNSLLQSGTSIGAIMTPLLVSWMLTPEEGSWRWPFKIIGTVGTVWMVFWLVSVRSSDIPSLIKKGEPATASGDPSYFQAVISLRFLVLVSFTISINTCWHFFRVWLLKFLQEGRGYSEEYALYITSLYYVGTAAGIIVSGIAATWLAKRAHFSVHASRLTVFAACACLTGLGSVVQYLPAGPLLIGVLLVIGFGALGLYPTYYSLSQELTVQHQGKISGTLGVFAWIVPSLLHPLIGMYLDHTKKLEGFTAGTFDAVGEPITTAAYELPIAVVGWVPMIPLILALVLWNRGVRRST
jgi:ACS family hexuronate transporter-like MFS transporter